MARWPTIFFLLICRNTSLSAKRETKESSKKSKLFTTWQKCGAVVQNFYHLARQLVGRLARKDVETWATVAWSIWNARNRFCFEEKQSQPKDILQAATTLMQDYQR